MRRSTACSSCICRATKRCRLNSAANRRAGGAPVDITALPPKSRRIREIRGREITMIFQEPMSSLSPVHTIGSQIIDPNIDYAKMAVSMGVYAEGPIDNPNDLGPALKRAIAVVKRGEPALVDVVTQVR